MAALPVGQCVPVTPSRNNMENRNGEEMSHFISLEIQENRLLEVFSEKLKVLQEDMDQVPGIGKPTKPTSIHITVAVLNIRSEELAMVTERVNTAVMKYIDLTNPVAGITIGFQGVGWGDDAMWLSMKLGVDSLKILRELLEDEVGAYLTDSRFSPHVTIYRKCQASEEMKAGVRASLGEVKMGCLTIKGLSLRERKINDKVPEPCQTWSFMSL